MKPEASPWLNLMRVGTLPSAVLLSGFLFTITERGADKFGITVLAVLVILPLGALVSFTGAIYRTVRLAEREAWPKWLPQSMPILFLLALVLVAVTDVIIIGLGEVFGFYGILAMWLVLWAAVHLFFNYLIARRSNYKVE